MAGDELEEFAKDYVATWAERNGVTISPEHAAKAKELARRIEENDRKGK